MAALTTEILIEIRDEIRATRTDVSSRIDQTNGRIDHTNQRLDQTNERTLLEDRHLRQTVDNHEQRIRSLESART